MIRPMKKFIVLIFISLFGITSLFASPLDEEMEVTIGYESYSCKGNYTGTFSLGLQSYIGDHLFVGGSLGLGIRYNAYADVGWTFDVYDDYDFAISISPLVNVYASEFFDVNQEGEPFYGEVGVGTGCLAGFHFYTDDCMNLGVKFGYDLSYSYKSEYGRRFLNHYYLMCSIGCDWIDFIRILGSL